MAGRTLSGVGPSSGGSCQRHPWIFAPDAVPLVLGSEGAHVVNTGLLCQFIGRPRGRPISTIALHEEARPRLSLRDQQEGVRCPLPRLEELTVDHRTRISLAAKTLVTGPGNSIRGLSRAAVKGAGGPDAGAARPRAARPRARPSPQPRRRLRRRAGWRTTQSARPQRGTGRLRARQGSRSHAMAWR